MSGDCGFMVYKPFIVASDCLVAVGVQLCTFAYVNRTWRA